MRHLNGTTPPWLADLRRLNGTRRLVIEQLWLNALRTLDAIEDPDAGRFDIRTSWPKFPREWHAYSVDPDDVPEPRFTPSPADHDRMLIALAWGRGLTRQQLRIAQHAADGYSYGAIGDRLHLPAAVVAQLYDQALDVVVAAALRG